MAKVILFCKPHLVEPVSPLVGLHRLALRHSLTATCFLTQKQRLARDVKRFLGNKKPLDLHSRWFGRPRKDESDLLVVQSKVSVDNRELLTGDCLILVAFCLYKQITAIVLQPGFPGWLAPLKFNPGRFEELASFATTLTVAWVLSSLLVGGYRSSATSDLPTALTRVSMAWLVSMPVAACQLVLLTAAEGKTLVGGETFASTLPLAASGPGEPVATAAGVLGLMALWRCFYTVFLDFFNARQWGGSGAQIDRNQDFLSFMETLQAVFLISLACIIIINFLAQGVGEEAMEKVMAPITSWIM